MCLDEKDRQARCSSSCPSLALEGERLGISGHLLLSGSRRRRVYIATIVRGLCLNAMVLPTVTPVLQGGGPVPDGPRQAACDAGRRMQT